MTSKKILVVDDDSAIRNLLVRFFGSHNFRMAHAENGKTALTISELFDPDLVILDVILPDMSGFEVCKQIKKSQPGVLVMLLTGLTAVEEQVIGLEWADVYVTKPFHLSVLEKQVEALFRLIQPSTTLAQRQPLKYGKLVIDSQGREVTLNNQPVSLTTLEFDILHCLAQHPKQAWSREQLIKEVWGHDFMGELRIVDVHVGAIRRKIEPNRRKPIVIQTIRGFGYKFEPAIFQKSG